FRLAPKASSSHTDRNSPSVHDYLDQQSTALIFAQEALKRAKDHQKEHADKRRRDHDYKVGDKILPREENITMPADSGLSSDKLKPRFIGPSTLLEQRSPSPLAFSRRTPAPTPPVVIEGSEEYEVESILRYRKY
ncbi:hypothetical protein BGZ90_002463, partial [Linnemannia elongata]